jgi:Na+/melibiose symporter-like transporter
MKKRFHRGYLILGTFLATISYGLTLLLYPEWRYSWGLLLTLLVIVISGVVSFVAGVRQAFENPSDSASTAYTQNKIITNTIDNHKSCNFTHKMAGAGSIKWPLRPLYGLSYKSGIEIKSA